MKASLALGVIAIAAGVACGTVALDGSQPERAIFQRTQGSTPSTNLSGVPPIAEDAQPQIIKGRTNYRIRDGRISRPFVMWAGILAGGNLPGACAVIFRENPFGNVARDTWQIT